MAKYKGIVWSDARGKVNGLVYSRNTYGVYVRGLSSPVQPQTLAQMLVRAHLQNLTRAWRDLAQTQRDAWNALAAQVTLTDTLGNTYNPSGEQLYTGLNMNLILIGNTPITNPPPTPVEVPTPSQVTVTATGGGTPALGVAWIGGSANYQALIYATSTISQGRNFIRPSEFRLITIASGTGSPTLNILPQWQNKYGPAPDPADGKVAVRVKLVDPNTGFAGGFTHGVAVWAPGS